jgi:hypothetical protein
MKTVEEKFAELRSFGPDGYAVTPELFVILKAGFVAGFASGAQEVERMLLDPELTGEEKQAALYKLRNELLHLGSAAAAAGQSENFRDFI